MPDSQRLAQNVIFYLPGPHCTGTCVSISNWAQWLIHHLLQLDILNDIDALVAMSIEAYTKLSLAVKQGNGHGPVRTTQQCDVQPQ